MALAGSGDAMVSEEMDGWPPKDPEIPSLGELEATAVANLVLSRVLQRRGLEGAEGFLLDNLVRLSDKAVREYEQGREHGLRFAAGNAFLAYFRAVDSFENAVDAVWRMTRFAERIISRRPETAEPYLEFPDEEGRERVRLLRNAIQHTDERIVQQGFEARDSRQLLILNSGLQLRGHFVGFEELARWIAAYRAFGDGLAQYFDAVD